MLRIDVLDNEKELDLVLLNRCIQYRCEIIALFELSEDHAIRDRLLQLCKKMKRIISIIGIKKVVEFT